MGILVALANAVSTSFLDVFLKKLSGFSPNFLTWVRVAAAAPVLAILVSVFSAWAVPPQQFWLILLSAVLPLEIVLAYLGTKAIQISPLSLISPLGATASLFLIPVGFVVLGELPNLIGAIGVVFIVVGSFFLGWRRGEEALRYGLRNVFRERGAYLALGGAFLASIVVTLAKFQFRYAAPLLTAFYTSAVIAVTLLPFAFMRSADSLRLRLRHLGGLGLMSGIGQGLHYTGLSLIPVVYYISVKRMSTVFNVFWGRAFFGEDHTIERLAGALLMVAGVILIALG